jgi:hypothetical protein
MGEFARTNPAMFLLREVMDGVLRPDWEPEIDLESDGSGGPGGRGV